MWVCVCVRACYNLSGSKDLSGRRQPLALASSIGRIMLEYSQFNAVCPVLGPKFYLSEFPMVPISL